MGDPTIDDAVAFLVDYLTRPKSEQGRLGLGVSNYGYDVHVPNLLDLYLNEVERSTEQYPSQSSRGQLVSVSFYEAAWHLCRVGVLRPSVRDIQGQATADGASGNGYSLTTAGRRWLARGTAAAATLQVDRLSTMFLKLGERLGDGFVQRATEAVACHKMGAYLACCTMCGAGAESVLLAVAIAKQQDEAKVLSAYKAASGRKRVMDMVVGGLKAGLASPFTSATGLLSYWRDEAAHGVESTISEIEAHEALGQLLRFAQFATDNWTQLTNSPQIS